MMAHVKLWWSYEIAYKKKGMNEILHPTTNVITTCHVSDPKLFERDNNLTTNVHHVSDPKPIAYTVT